MHFVHPGIFFCVHSGRKSGEEMCIRDRAEPMSEYVMHILTSGGIKPMIRAQQAAKKKASGGEGVSSQQ